MKKLRLNDEEKKNFLVEVYARLKNPVGRCVEDINIDDIKKNLSKVPKDVPTPTIRIKAETYIKMLELINQSHVEISWHGLVKRDKEKNLYTIYDVIVFPQINSATTTTTDEKEFAEWQTNLIMDMSFPIEDLRMHGHSHVNMNVFSSGVDDQYQKDLIHKVEDGDYYIFLIMNKKMEMCVLLYDFDSQILFETKDINLEIGDTTDIISWAAYEMKEKCSEEVPVVKGRSNFVWDEYNGCYDYGGIPTNKKKENVIGKNKKSAYGGKKNGSK